MSSFRHHTALISILLFILVITMPLHVIAQASSIEGFEKHVYKIVKGEELELYINKPREWSINDSRPAIVFFHGGGWISGKPFQFLKQAKYFSSRGLVTVLVQYRLLTKGVKEPPDRPIRDAKSAMRWVRSHAGELGVDPNRIASAGGSAGGHLAAFVGMVDGIDDPEDDLGVSAKANAMILFNPVLDNGPSGWQHGRVKSRYKEYSPFHNVTPDDPPAIVFVGDIDHLVPVATVCAFKSNLEAMGRQIDARIFRGAGHSFFSYQGGKNPAYFETLLAADEFLRAIGWLSAPSEIQIPPSLDAKSEIYGCP